MSQNDWSTFLDLGWKVDTDLHPLCWVGDTQHNPTELDLVRIPTNKIDRHAVIIAQSGSGKSFFLGRLIEEILIKTKSRCLILDPNGDFRNLSKIQDNLWSQDHPQKYDKIKGGKITLEGKNNFETEWTNIIKDYTMKTNRDKKELSDTELKIWWPSASLEFLLNDNDPRKKTEMFHCHNLAKLLLDYYSKTPADTSREDIITRVKDVFKSLQEMPNDERQKLLEELKTGSPKVLERIKKMKEKSLKSKLRKIFKILIKSSPFYESVRDLDLPSLGNDFVEKAKYVFEYYSWGTVNAYFGLMAQYQSLGILTNKPYSSSSHNRLEVIDLTSLNNAEVRALVINSILTQEWEFSKNNWEDAMKNPNGPDERVPTFIILDEAHNFIPSSVRSPHENAVREQFRTIAAEGRKYGLFLILVSQRADKLDESVLSECANKAIMRLDSDLIREQVVKALGLEYIGDIEKNLRKFRKGVILLAGNWCVHETPITLYSAARRTVEGGKDLDSRYWATARSEK